MARARSATIRPCRRADDRSGTRVRIQILEELAARADAVQDPPTMGEKILARYPEPPGVACPADVPTRLPG